MFLQYPHMYQKMKLPLTRGYVLICVNKNVISFSQIYNARSIEFI